ncbi:MAG: ribosome-associated translation inhibitor RaiA [Acidobacteria bacterium]|nr:ribosome-associated translation inhibitor RaiA [Acidobacteriota bacterium]
MNVEITGRHIEVTPALRSFIAQHLERIPRVLGDNIAIHVVLTVEKKRHICEIVLKSKTGQLTCLEQTSDMYASIAKAAHRMQKQIVKTKKRRVEVKRRETGSTRRKVPVAGGQTTVSRLVEETISEEQMPAGKPRSR